MNLVYSELEFINLVILSHIWIKQFVKARYRGQKCQK